MRLLKKNTNKILLYKGDIKTVKAKRQAKVKILHNEYFQRKTQEQVLEKKQLKALKSYRRFKKLVVIALLVITVLAGKEVIQNQLQINQINQQNQKSQTILKKNKKESAQLEQKIKQLQDQDYLQKYIREKYYYTKDNEQVYNLPKSKNNSPFSEK